MSASIGSTDHLSTNHCSSPRRSLYTFSHDRTIKRFPRIAFRFATCIGFVHCPSAFGGYFQSSLLLMLPQGFGDPIAGFANPHNETGRDTPYLTIGHTPWSFGGWATSSRGAFAFPSRGHRVSTTATHGTRTVGGRKLFLYLFFCSRASTPSACSATAASSAWWRWTSTGRSGGRAAHGGSPSPIFVDRGDCIGVCDVANTSAPSTLLSIFIEQIQPSP